MWRFVYFYILASSLMISGYKHGPKPKNFPEVCATRLPGHRHMDIREDDGTYNLKVFPSFGGHAKIRLSGPKFRGTFPTIFNPNNVFHSVQNMF